MLSNQNKKNVSHLQWRTKVCGINRKKFKKLLCPKNISYGLILAQKYLG